MGSKKRLRIVFDLPAVVINMWNERYDSYMVILKHLDTRKYLVSHRRIWS